MRGTSVPTPLANDIKLLLDIGKNTVVLLIPMLSTTSNSRLAEARAVFAEMMNALTISALTKSPLKRRTSPAKTDSQYRSIRCIGRVAAQVTEVLHQDETPVGTPPRATSAESAACPQCARCPAASAASPEGVVRVLSLW